MISMVLGIAILLVGSNPMVFAQANTSNQTAAPGNSSEPLGKSNLSTTSLDALSNMSNITTPAGDVNTYR